MTIKVEPGYEYLIGKDKGGWGAVPQYPASGESLEMHYKQDED